MSEQKTVLAFGFFDGVHLGHGALLRRASEEAKRRGVRSAVFTFDPSPEAFFSRGQFRQLLTREEKRSVL